MMMIREPLPPALSHSWVYAKEHRPDGTKDIKEQHQFTASTLKQRRHLDMQPAPFKRVGILTGSATYSSQHHQLKLL